MPRRDDDYGDLDDREYPEPDEEDNDVASLVSCPYCRKSIHEDAPRCHHCGHWQSAEDAPARKPWWVVVAVLLCLAGVVYYVWRG